MKEVFDMYAHEDIWIEDICYDMKHIRKVVLEIKKNFEKYFNDFILTAAGAEISSEDFEKLKKNLGIQSSDKHKNKNLKANYKNIIVESINDFEKDRKKYLDIFDEELLEEYQDDPAFFKSKILKNECPIIHSTIYNKRAKELDKYRAEFSRADANEMLNVVEALCSFGNEYMNDIYDRKSYEDITDYEELAMYPMDTDKLTVYGVIGGGIKSHMLFKVYPEVFPNRSRNAIWALWFLSSKKTFDCLMDSEFLMIDIRKSITQQNYFYPYELFSFYAFEIYKMLRDKAIELDAYIDIEYRYVIVDEFLSFVANKHDEEISFLKAQIRDGGLGYA